MTVCSGCHSGYSYIKKTSYITKLLSSYSLTAYFRELRVSHELSTSFEKLRSPYEISWNVCLFGLSHSSMLEEFLPHLYRLIKKTEIMTFEFYTTGLVCILVSRNEEKKE